MPDLYLLPVDQNQAASSLELPSALTWPSAAAAPRLSALLAALDVSELGLQEILELSRSLAAEISQQLRDNKLKPQNFRAILNDVPAPARGALEDALRAINIGPAYHIQGEQGGVDIVNPATERAIKRPNPVAALQSVEPLDLRQRDGIAAQTGYPWPDTAKDAFIASANTVFTARDASEIRLGVDAMALAAKEVFDQAGTPIDERQALIEAPAHLTGALECALARQGIAALHPHAQSGKTVRGATMQSGAEQRGLKAVREAFGAAGKGVPDSRIREALGAQCIQSLGQLPPAVIKQAADAALAHYTEGLTDAARRVDVVLEAVKAVSATENPMPRADADTEQKAPHEPGPSRTRAKARATAVTVPTPIDAATDSPEADSPVVTPADAGLALLRDYLLEAIAPRRDAKLPTTLEKDIAHHISRTTLENFAQAGMPRQELDTVSQLLAKRAASAGVSAPDRLDVVYLRQVALDCATEGNSRIFHEGKSLCSVAQLRQALPRADH